MRMDVCFLLRSWRSQQYALTLSAGHVESGADARGRVCAGVVIRTVAGRER